jgi:hypothetical protein
MVTIRPCDAKSVYSDFFSAPFFTFSFKFWTYSVCVGSSMAGADAPDAATTTSSALIAAGWVRAKGVYSEKRLKWLLSSSIGRSW